jgi:hypothetical protein
MEIQRDNIWVAFYPVIERGEDGDDDIIDLRPRNQMEDDIDGKYQNGICGNNIIWKYVRVQKEMIRECIIPSMTIF